MCPNPTAPTLRNPTSDPDSLSILSLLACHPLLTHFSSLFRRTSHHFVVFTPAFSNSSHVSFHGVRVKTFSTHVTTYIVPDVRETWLFTHVRATVSSKIISMCTPCVAVPCLCDAGQGCAMPLHHRTIGSSRARIIVVLCFPTTHLIPRLVS